MALTKYACNKFRVEAIRNPVEVYFTFQFLNYRRKDLDNFAATIKFILDSLVLQEIIPDDSIKVVRLIQMDYQIGKVEGVKVTIAELAYAE